MDENNNMPNDANKGPDEAPKEAPEVKETVSQPKEDQVTLKLNKNTMWMGATVVLALLFIVSLATGGFGFGDDTPTGAVVAPTPTAPTPTEPPVEQRISVSIDDDHVKGDEDAPVTIIEFSDYECPFCGRFYTQTLPQIESEYIDTGKVKLVFRDFPLGFHPSAQPAAEAAQCAGDQGMYYEMHDKIFDNQDLLGQNLYSTWAEELGLDVDEFDECVSSGKYTSEVQKDMADGSSAGVTGTPSFFIGNDDDGYVQIGGAQPFTVFQQVIEAELA